MREVAIIGVGMTPVGEHWDQGLRMLAAQAAHEALTDAATKAIDALYVANAYGTTFSSQSHLGGLVADYIGLKGIEAITIEAAEASGAAALRAACLAVKSGEVQTALVIGVEKSTDCIGSAQTQARTVSLDADFEAIHGATLPALAALLMRRYMHEFQVGLDAFEAFSINAHANGKRNPYAMFRNTIKPGAFSKAPMVADPVNLFDSAPDADGAAAVIVTSAERAADLVAQPVLIAGSAAATDAFTLQDRADLLHLDAVAISTQKALAQAGLTVDDVDFFELHDAFTILSTLSLEAAGFAERGTGWQLADGSKLPLCTFGGLKSRGNPAGATGVYQAVEAVLQLRGKAGENQINNPRVALIQNLSGLASTAVTHVLTISESL
ncbi:MAG: thiolase domain-containing protein [Phototrophicales bacterium]|nr:MAG: acetyl-CoA acetyltransferase [Phototrophicales bacterium]RMG74189.1 MAG: hypothetical protein D6711_09305 [Chloroflexota bacterium]